jgi:P27 family predicted phage terminase small subunit
MPRPPGRTPKRAGTQQGHRKQALVVLHGDGPIDPPPPPPGLLKRTEDRWVELWSQPVAGSWTVSDHAAVERYISYLDEWERMRKATKAHPVVAGSKGQPVISPTAKHMLVIEQALQRLEADLGLTPLARQRLGIAIGTAAKTIEDLARESDEGTDTEPDPRLQALDVEATTKGKKA